VWADGEMAYGALDAIGGSAIESVLDSIRAGGRVLLYGALGGPEVRYSVIKVIYAVSQHNVWRLLHFVPRLEGRALPLHALSRV
jgi:NADPH:quinone reductase-like Zn-dependent oxidoreductase